MDILSSATPAQKAAAAAKWAAIVQASQNAAPSPNALTHAQRGAVRDPRTGIWKYPSSTTAQPRNSAGQYAPTSTDRAWGSTGRDYFTVEQMTAARNRGVPPGQLFPQGVYTPSSGGTGFSLSGNDVPGMNRTAAENAAYNAAKLAAMSQSERNTMYRLQAENAAKAAQRNGTSMRDSIYGTPDPNSPGQRFGPPAYTGPQYGPPASSSGTPWSTIPFVGNPVRTPYQTAPTYTPPATSNPNNYRPPNNYAGYTGPGYTPAQQQAPIYNPAGPPGADNPAQYRDPLYDSNGNWITGKPAQNTPPNPPAQSNQTQTTDDLSVFSSVVPSWTIPGKYPINPNYDPSQRISDSNQLVIAPPDNRLTTPITFPIPPPPQRFPTPNPADQSNQYQQPQPYRPMQTAPNGTFDVQRPTQSTPTQSKAWAPLTPEKQAEFDAYNAQQRAAAAAEKVRWDGVLAANKAANDARYGTGWDAPAPTGPTYPGNQYAGTFPQGDWRNDPNLRIDTKHQQPQQPIPGSWADQMQQRTATRYPTTQTAGQINASSWADQRQQSITNSQATRTQAQIESQRITPEEIERNRIMREGQGPLVKDQMAPYKEKSLSQGSGPAQGYNRIYGGAAGSGYQDVLSQTGGGQTFYAPSAIGNNTPITPPPSRWPAPNQPDTSNNYQQPPLTYGPRQTAATGWVPSPQPQSSQAGFDYGPPPQMSDRVSRLAGAGAPAKVPAWMTAGHKR